MPINHNISIFIKISDHIVVQMSSEGIRTHRILDKGAYLFHNVIFVSGYSLVCSIFGLTDLVGKLLTRLVISTYYFSR